MVEVSVGVLVGGCVAVLVGVSVGVCVTVGVKVGVAVMPTPDSDTLLPSTVRTPLAGIPSIGEKDTPTVQEPLAATELHPATASKTVLETDKLGSGRGEELLFRT